MKHKIIIKQTSQIVKCFLVVLQSYIYFTFCKVYNAIKEVSMMLKIRELRKKCGITMKELGAAIGAAESTISQYETGKRQPDYETLLKIAEFFGVTTDYLLTGEDTKKAPTQEDERTISDKELMFALWGDSQNVDESDLEDVRRYAAFVEERKKKK